MPIDPKRVARTAALLAALTTPVQAAHANNSTIRTETSSLVATAELSGEDDCQSWHLSLELRIDNDSANGATLRRELSSVTLRQTNWCLSSSISLSASWPNLNGASLNEALRSASLNLQRSVDIVECSYSGDPPSCSTRAVPLSLTAVWTNSGDMTANTTLHMDNLSGVAQRISEVFKSASTDVTCTMATGGTGWTFSSSYGSLFSRVNRQSTTP
jgi:hypothetical protein